MLLISNYPHRGFPWKWCFFNVLCCSLKVIFPFYTVLNVSSTQLISAELKTKGLIETLTVFLNQHLKFLVTIEQVKEYFKEKGSQSVQT